MNRYLMETPMLDYSNAQNPAVDREKRLEGNGRI